MYELYEVAFAGLWQFEYPQDSVSAMYSAEQDGNAPELYRVDVAQPGTSTKLNSPITTGGGVWAFIVKAGAAMTP